MFFLNLKKKGSSRPFLAHSGGGQETTFHLRVASGKLPFWCQGKYFPNWQPVRVTILLEGGVLGNQVRGHAVEEGFNREGAKNSGGKKQAQYQCVDYRCTAGHFLRWHLSV